MFDLNQGVFPTTTLWNKTMKTRTAGLFRRRFSNLGNALLESVNVREEKRRIESEDANGLRKPN